MLEKPSLLLRPWSLPSVGAAGGRMRTIADSAGAAVGFVADVKPQTSRWLRWLSPRTLEVYETPDQSLVFTLRRGWGWLTAWHLVDADDRLVGTFRGRALLDGFGHFLAVIEPPDDLGCGRFLAVEGRELGEYALEPHQTKVTFAAELEGNPFARMLLLGAVLVRQA